MLNSIFHEHYYKCSDLKIFINNIVKLSRTCTSFSLAAVGAPRMVSLEPLSTRGAVRVTWSPPTDLCGLTNPQYTIEHGTTAATPTTHPSTPSSSPFDITGLDVGEEYFVRLAIRSGSGSGTFSSWESVTTYEGENNATVLF